MDVLAQNLRARGRELGLADAEIARRCGLSQARYQHYVVGRRTPDFQTFLRICDVLGTTPNALLGFEPSMEVLSERARLLNRAEVALRSLPDDRLQMAVRLVDSLALEGANESSHARSTAG